RWAPAGGTYFGLQPRIWNSFVDMQGSIFAGSTFRDNGNGTFETTGPPAYYGINVPFPAGWPAGTVLAGSRLLRFQPLDLYVMGFLPIDQLPTSYRAFITEPATQVVKPDLGAEPVFSGAVGPAMGLRVGVAIRPTLR